MEKGKPKTKKKTGGRPAKRKGFAKKPTRRKAPGKALKTALGAVALGQVAGAADDPIGCCFWVDASGQNRFGEMTQSACRGKANSTFRPNKKCPGGSG
jgi:hypothetical protein